MRLAVFPLTPLNGNLILETAIEGLVLAQGGQVLVVACDGLRPHCMMDLFYDRAASRQESCRQCHKETVDAVKTLGQAQGMSVVHMTDLVDPEEQQRLIAMADSLSEEAIMSLVHDGLPFGRWIEDGLRMAYFGEDWQQLEDRETLARQWLRSMFTTWLTAHAVLRQHAPDAFLTLNGLVPCERVVWGVGRQHGVRSLTYEGGQQPATVFLDTELPACYYDVREGWEHWKDVPLSRAENQRLNRMLTDRMYSAGGGFVYSPTVTGKAHLLMDELKLEAGRPLITAFTNSMGDTSVFDSNRIFIRQMDWIDTCIRHAQAHPEYDLVIRIHPVEGTSKTLRYGQSIDVRTKIASGITEHWPELPANVRLVDALDSVSSYELMQASRVVLTYVSTIGIEAACMNLPVLAAGEYHYTDKGFVHTAPSADTYPAVLDRLMAAPEPPPHAQELARRYLYLWMYRASLHLTSLEAPPARIAVSSLVNRPIWDLMRGRVPAHDHLVDYIRGEAPQVRPPAPWRPRDRQEPLRLEMQPGFHVVLASDWRDDGTIAQTLCAWAQRYGPGLSVQALAGNLAPEAAAQHLVDAMSAVAPPDSWPEIDVIPGDVPDEILGQILCHAHILLVTQRDLSPVQSMARDLQLSVVAVTDLTAVKEVSSQLDHAATAKRHPSPIS